MLVHQNKMRKALIYSIVLLILLLSQIQPATAKQLKADSNSVIACFSGGKEIMRAEMLSGPFADEYKFAHEVKVKDATGEHSLNFAGGLCIIDRGEVSLAKKLPMTDNLVCYSGMSEAVAFEVYGRETTVDEYVEGRTFLAKARGIAFNSNTLHEYLVFGNSACIGEEVS